MRDVFVGLYLLALLGASGVQPQPGSSGQLVQLSVTTRFYDVTGNNGLAIRRQIASLGPVSPEGKRFDAYTDWKTKWDYTYDSAANGFYVSSATVSLDITFTLPRWTAPKDTDRAMLNEWKAYFAALMVHESGHSNVAWQCADKLLNNLNRKNIFGNRTELKEFVETEGKKCLTEAKEKNLIYDKQTDNGAKQGARLRLK
jgi:predicted secreted Zn-dependent protease